MRIGKAGVCINTKTLSTGELERLSRVYIEAFAPFIGPDRDILAPDMYTNGIVIAWMSDELISISSQPPAPRSIAPACSRRTGSW